jgi:penicillin-binding protein 1A
MDGPLIAREPLAPRVTNQDRGNKTKGGVEGGQKPQKTSRPPAGRRSSWRLIGRVVGLFTGLFVLAGVGGMVALFVAYQHYAADLPNVDGLRHYQPRVMSRIYAGDSQLMAELATERRLFIPFSAIPDLVKQAFVSAEDQNFWVHRGVDPFAMARAAVTDVLQMGQGRRPVGASTITQQVAKNMLLGNEVSINRKVREALLAMRIEGALSKERILELYLNEIYLGNQSYGVAAAAQAYFSKSLDDLTIAEAAFLAALPKGPNNYNPQRFPDAARGRRDWVLDRMADTHAITPEQAAAAKTQPIQTAVFHKPDTVHGADYFAEDVRRALVDRFGPDKTTQGGLAVRTSLDPALQAQADRSLREGLMAYDRARGGWRGPIAHLDGTPAALRSDWTRVLPQVARPPGMLTEWRTAVVLEATENEAKLGWIERPSPGPLVPPVVHIGSVLLSDIAWARPVRDGHVGGTPRRIGDVMQIGDVVMVEPAPVPANPVRPARGERLNLRQIPQVEGALVALDPRTGRVLALSGGWSYEMSQFDRASQALRQPGSSFKPFVYLTAMEQGLSPNTIFDDAPIVVDLGAAGVWRPQNSELEFFGPVPLHTALEKSLNLVTLRVARKVGMEAVAQNAIAFHVVDNMPRVLPAAIGAVDTTVLRMAGAYASLAEGGREVVPSLIDSVQDRDGNLIWRPQTLECNGCAADSSIPPLLEDHRQQLADAASAFQVVQMMEGVTLRGTGVGAVAGLNRPVAGKTGTTQDYNDAWFGGFTPDLVTIVWVGFDQPETLGVNAYGAEIAAPIWRDFMLTAMKGRPVLQFVPPPDVTLVTSGGVTEAFKIGQSQSGGGDDSASSGNSAATAAGGLDTGMGGLY